jgi:hypothetical protein
MATLRCFCLEGTNLPAQPPRPAAFPLFSNSKGDFFTCRSKVMALVHEFDDVLKYLKQIGVYESEC